MLSTRFFRFFRHLNLATLREIIKRVGERRLAGLSAEMAYNAMLAICPAILAFLAAIGLFESLQSTIYELARQVAKFAPDDVRILIRSLIQELSITRNQRLFSLSFIASLWAFSGALSAAMAALDQIYQIPPSKARPFWLAKLVSLALTLGTILLLINASALVFISDLIVRLVASQGDDTVESGLLRLWRLFTWPMALGIVSVAFGFIYRYGPSRWPVGTPVMPGAVLAALFWAILSGLFRLYVSHFGNYNRTYGIVGAVIILLLWLYLSSLVMLIGAQLNVTVGEAMRRPK
ncbi:MAG: YihY/virulence factor BrkB family protein [Microcoleus vaginatus WJT46-NPBG5]|jgi:membrane protein|nr:YihY/virulence factor BrkB family protein [Microcoleus vaginatus WJT46-NPBG5]